MLFRSDGHIYAPFLTASNSAASSSIMTIDASINYKNVVTLKQVSYNGDFSPNQIFDQPANSGFDVWAISTKYETPIFNFYSASDSYDRGMWVNYQPIQSEKEGIFLEFSDPFPQVSNRPASYTGSLLDVCGFNADEAKRKLGQLAETKEISEAIVAIPIDSNGKRYQINSQTFKLLTSPQTLPGKRSEEHTSELQSH